ncbi:hypothetical protein ACTO5A_23105 [Pseudomonas aeruginosa]|jgi:hypothetical protein|uniref:Uncharacterized protein n=1 Tax=Ectopseudomonas oleovorans TaxID=301 RepID=A0A379PLQ0_ECTOL|nr:hypothetical protein [Pseudomonas oleovorans]ELQ8317964.1 hypothetical protein [Pseudomonas aeruginosa]MBP7824722.1 hypothetical protein [Pseudomonas sp.]OZB34791.1 MAG: hypothetical protein B7X51_00965 [Pseudomonas sp. 34-62-33]MBI6902600.1 hypothetical protein [Pseudomonas aeruginosa]OWK37233.1 hypothetical protein PSOLE_43740 [Pseudomonas oleovorans subsp. oleovorans]
MSNADFPESHPCSPDEVDLLQSFSNLSDDQRKVALQAIENLVEARELGGLEGALDQLIKAAERKITQEEGKKLAESILLMTSTNDWMGMLNLIGRNRLN